MFGYFLLKNILNNKFYLDGINQNYSWMCNYYLLMIQIEKRKRKKQPHKSKQLQIEFEVKLDFKKATNENSNITLYKLKQTDFENLKVFLGLSHWNSNF